MAYRTDNLEFATYCNSLSSGYLKEWKAESMMSELNLGNYQGDALVTWVHGCLTMEGFSPSDCNKIVAYLTKED